MLSSKLINLLINKVYASFGHSLFTKSSKFVVNRELLKLSIFDLLKFLRFISLGSYLWPSEFLLIKMKLRYWSEMSVIIDPAKWVLWGLYLRKIWSMREAECIVTLVGFVIVGMKPFDMNMSR